METMQAFVSNSAQGTEGALLDWNLPSNYCNNFLQELDSEYDLVKAEKQAIESGSITPLVKQELKLLIQSRRLSQGKDEMRVEFGEPCRHQLTHAEQERRQRRKDQNRRAAKRLRQNKKFRESTLLERAHADLLQEISLLEGKNEGLRDKVTELRRLKNDLLSHLFHHLVSCPSSPTPFIASSSTLSPTFTYSPPRSDDSTTNSCPTSVSMSSSPSVHSSEDRYSAESSSYLSLLGSFLPSTSVPDVGTPSSP